LDTFSSNVFIVFTVKAISTVVGMATGILVARSLGPTGKGSYALITTLPALVFCLVHLGVAEANVYFLRKQTHQMDPAVIRGNTMAFTILISGFTVATLLLLKPYLCSTFLSELPDIYFYIILLLVPFFLFDTFGSSLLVAFEQFKLLSAINLALRFVDTFVVVAVLYIFDLGLMGVVLAYLLYFVLKSAAFFLVGFWRQPIRRIPDLRSMYSSIKFGLKSHAQSLTGVLHYKIDIYILALFLTPGDIGYYSIAVALVSLIFYIPDVVGHVMYPKVASLNEKDAHLFTAQTCRNTLFVTILPAAGIIVFGRFLIRLLYGQEFLPATSALYLLMPGTITMCLYKILTRNFTSRNRQELTVFAGLFGLLINVGLNLMLIPRMGIAGAALATSISYSSTSILLLFFFLRQSGIRAKDSLFINGSDISAIVQTGQSIVFPHKIKPRVQV